MIKTLSKVWYEKQLTEKDYDNLSDLMLIAIVVMLIFSLSYMF